MKSFARSIFGLVRPFGLRRLAIVFAFTLAQGVTQLLAVFSLLPFLNAAANIEHFRTTQFGRAFAALAHADTDRKLILSAGLLSLIILILSNAVTLLAEYVRGKYAYRFGHWLRMQLLRKLMLRKYEYFLSVNSSVLLKHLVDDISVLVANILVPSLDVISRAIIVVLLALTILVFEPKIFFGSLVILALYYALAIRPIRMRASGTSDRSMTFIRGLYLEVYQTLSGVKPILASDRQTSFVRRCEEASRAYSEEIPRVPIYGAIPRAGLEVLVFGGLISWVLITVLSGGDLVMLMPRVGLIAVVAYRLMPSLQLLLGQTMTITASRQALDEVLRLLDEQHLQVASAKSRDLETVEPWVAPLEWHDAIRFENVTFQYAGGEAPALDQASFEIRKGQRVAFVGPTGSGKSTLIDLLLGLLHPTSGRICIDTQELTPDLCRAWRRALGYVPQDLFLYDASIAENIAFGLRDGEFDPVRVREAAGIAHATEFIERQSSEGFAANVGERGTWLSGGQRQRIALARALYERPNLLVLDEATSALDPRTEEGVVASLADTHDKLTVVTITHRLGTIRDYDVIHFVRAGKIVAAGTYDELQKLDIFQEFSR
jgi:ATP-binding cassette subfamily C protein